MADFEQAIGRTLVREGGAKYTNDPDDRGGETKYGISKRSFPNEDIMNLTEDRAKEIYKREYWDRLRADDIKSQQIAAKLFDTAVNIGVRTAAKLAQQCLDIEPVDGFLGANSLKVVNKADPEHFLTKYTLAQVARYVYIVKNRPANRKYIMGWLNRALGEV